MKAELVHTTTTDGIRLDGALVSPADDAGRHPTVDALLMIHGTGANFYASSLLSYLAEHFSKAGIAALLANTRGRDLAYTAGTFDGPRRLGAAFERVDDCRRDLPAWFDLLRGRGNRRIGLLGHSLGAIKGVYALAVDGDDGPDCTCLCAISPARLSHDYFLASPRGEEFRQTLQRAAQMVENGNADTLIDVRFPIPYLVTAAGYLDKYGPGERFNVLNHLGRLPCPTLFTFGSVEVRDHIAFAGLPEAIEAAEHAHLQVATIAGADHVYSGTRTELASRITRWLRSIG